jgi:hypothetical protein
MRPASVFTRLTSVNFTHQWGSPLVHNIKHPLTFIAQLALTIRGLDTKLCCCYSFSSFSSENLLKRILKCSLLASSHEMDELLSTRSLMVNKKIWQCVQLTHWAAMRLCAPYFFSLVSCHTILLVNGEARSLMG